MEERGLALALAMELGDAQVFDALLRHFEASTDPVIRRQLLGAAAQAKQPELAARARDYALEAVGATQRDGLADQPGQQRRQRLAGGARLAGRQLPGDHAPSWEWRRCRAPVRLQHVQRGGSRALSATWSERLKAMEGGPRALAQTVESIKLCAALKAKQSPLRLR